MSGLVDQQQEKKKGGDANDYSRFANIEVDEDDETTSSSSASSLQHQNIIQQVKNAMNHKEQGNQYFKQQQFKLAKEAYEDALLDLDKVKDKKTLDDLPDALQTDSKALLSSLYSNLAMIAIKEESWYKALTNANHALKYDDMNVKVLFRRAVANARLDAFEESKNDLMKCLELEPTNAAAKKELLEVSKKIKAQKLKEKASFGNIFNKGSVYDDREQERIERQKKQEEDKKIEEEEWKQANIKRVEDGLAEQTLEEWKKDKETFSSSDSDDEEDEEQKQKRKAGKKKKATNNKTESVTTTTTKKSESTGVEEKKKETPANVTKASPVPSNSADDVEYDEEEAKLIAETKAKGYCYFRNTNGTTVKQDFTPKAVGSVATDNSAGEVAKAAPTSAEEKNETTGVTASSWNYAGTWEERDMTEHVKTQLTERCQQVKDVITSSGAEETMSMSASIVKVNKIEGEAQIVMARGKKRHIFDFQLQLDFEITFQTEGSSSSGGEESTNNKKNKTVKGTLLLADVSPQSTFEYSIQWKKSIVEPDLKHAKQSVQQLHLALSDKLRSFETEYCAL